MLSREQTIKILNRLCGYTGWSAPLLLASNQQSRFLVRRLIRKSKGTYSVSCTSRKSKINMRNAVTMAANMYHT